MAVKGTATATTPKPDAGRAAFHKVKTSERLFLEVVRQIEERIIQGKLKPGDMLPAERIMAEQFGVSRTVIREAMKALELRGLVEVQHGRGVMVVRPSADNVADSVLRFLKIEENPIWSLHELRSILEVEFAGLAAERRTEEDLVALGDLIKKMAASLEAPAEYVEYDFEFHRALARAAHNPMFFLVLEPYVALMREARKLGATARNAPRRSIEFHRPVFEAIKKRDPAAARAAMREHFAYVAEFIAEAEARRLKSPGAKAR
jgi:GntR family transcriptional repressor for pyruvate dehydrogenase complex